MTVTVTDKHGGVGSDTLTVTVRNVAPTVDAGAVESAYWGFPVAFAGSASDPSNADTAAGFAFAWSFGDGGAATGAETVTDPIDAATGRLAGQTVIFAVGDVFLTALTDADGIATATTTLPLTPGSHEVHASFLGDERYLPSSTVGEVVVAFTPGKITAGLLRSVDLGRGGFNAHSDGTTMHGQLQWQKTGVNYHGNTVTALGIAPDGRSAWFAGADRNGVPYLAYVEDNGTPGTHDRFKLWIRGTLQTPSDGKLAGGNLVIHRP